MIASPVGVVSDYVSLTDSLAAAAAADQPEEFIAQLKETEIKFSRPGFKATLAHFHATKKKRKEKKSCRHF